jgi:hypothetical protein
MEADRDEARFTDGVARRSAAGATAKIAHNGLARANVKPIVVVAIAIPVVIAILRRGQCCKGYQHQDCE